MKFSDEYSLKKILFNKYNSLGRLCIKSQKLQLINISLKQALSELTPGLENYCQLVALKDNCLIIETSRSEYLTQLRFCHTDLLSSLRKQPELYQLISINFKVNPELDKRQLKYNHYNNEDYNKSYKQRNANISQSTKLKLLKLSENINNLKLKAAIQKLTK